MRGAVYAFIFECLTSIFSKGILTVPPPIVQLVLYRGGGKNLRKEPL